jgi:ATP-binding cassette subfamily C (CFTR/MRP) protein 4
MLSGLLRSPIKYFDKTPSGRLINRFSNDMSILDNILGTTFVDTIEGPILALVMLVNVFQIVPFFIIPAVINLILLGLWFAYCKRAIIQTKQLDLRMKSPVFSEFTQLVSGATQVKIYGQTERMNAKMSSIINSSIRVNHSFWFASRVFGSLTSYTSVIICGVGFFVGVSQIENGGLYGISIVFLLQVSDYLQWFLRQIINMESIMVSVERGFAVANLESEAPLRTEYDMSIGFKDEIEKEEQGVHISPEKTSVWPINASVEFKNFTMRYREKLDPVLHGISFRIEGGQKVGIVGRTGAGKSSIIQALFRMVTADPSSQLFVGEADALQMGLHSLRKNLSIIPQTPFLFKGTIQENIDPFNEYPEERIWEVL